MHNVTESVYSAIFSTLAATAPVAVAAKPFTLTMSRRQAQALAAALVVVDNRGEGAELDELYCALVDGGAEVEEVSAEVEGGFVVVTRDGGL